MVPAIVHQSTLGFEPHDCRRVRAVTVRLKAEGALEEDCQHRPVQYLSNVLEQDHRVIKRRVRASQHFRSFWGAWRTIAGYEAIHIIRKGQARQSAPGGMAILLHRFILGLFAATN
jgi:transposase-like protein